VQEIVEDLEATLERFREITAEKDQMRIETLEDRPNFGIALW
jgi:hypothetical protein